MSNHHLRDKRLSLKAKGLLSQMLSLPDDWDYTLSGLAYINRESKDAIRSAVNELERAGYVQRHQTTDASGKFSVNEYIIYERPISANPSPEKPPSDNPTPDKPLQDNPTQLNTKKSNTEKQSTDIQNTDSIPSFRESPEAKRCESKSEYQEYRDLICENTEYENLKQQHPWRIWSPPFQEMSIAVPPKTLTRIRKKRFSPIAFDPAAFPAVFSL